ncbi:MAG TPA: carbonic anhydrase [Pyrinomonadaceae bacterium]|nr:carbonic anhydrase [Pyrinomonadaceae bacterium]
MKNNLKMLKKFISLLLALMLLFSFTTIFMSGCGSSKASEEKSKSKKKKAVAEEEETDEEKDKEDKKEEKPEANKSDKKDEKTDDKKDSKKDEKVEKGPSGEDVWKDLMEGNKRFVAGKHTTPQLISMRQGLVAGQKPKAIILGCADSRVPPELLFDRNLGEIFVVRDAGNVADEVTLGSIEYAVEHLHVNLLVILGHESCGAVAAAVSGEEMPTKNLKAIVERIQPAFDGSTTCPLGGKSNLDCVKLNVEHSAEDVIKQSPIIKEALKENLTIIKAVYKLDTGEVTRLN